MTNQKVLEQAISKAIDGGWRGTDDNVPQQWLSTLKSDQVSIDNAGGEDQLFFKEEWYPVIFNHDFAKALWSEEQLVIFKREFVSEPQTGRKTHLPAWKYHLWQMVLAEDPIKYLGENI